MRKALVVLLVFVMVAPLFADDAKVLPSGVLRIYTVPVGSFLTGTWDEDGELTANKSDDDDSQPDGMIFSLGGAVEYGVTDQISAGFQWTPVYNFLKEADAASPDGVDGEPLFGGLNSLDIGAEVQILGNQGYVSNEKMRVSITPGMVVPMPTRDWKAEGKATADGDDFVSPGAEPLTQFAFGGLFNFDYVVTDEFFVNVFAETRYRLPRTVDYTDYYNEASKDAVGGEDVVDKYELEYGSNVFFETGLDLNYELPVSDSVQVNFGLPARFTLNTPREDTTTVETTTTGPGVEDDGETSVEPDDPSYTFYLDPSVGTFLSGLSVPLEFVATYRLPLFGQNASQLHSVALEGRVYLAF
ncbi:MAG: hypothetical protein ACOCWU_06865 [Spirochaetota bacterium]